MGRIADQLRQLKQQMEDSDRKLMELIEAHCNESEQAWQWLEEELLKD